MANPDFWGKSVLNFVASAWKLKLSRWMGQVACIAGQGASSSNGKVFDIRGGHDFRFAFGSLSGFVCCRREGVSWGGEKVALSRFLSLGPNKTVTLTPARA